MQNIIAVFIGGGFGAVLRYLSGIYFSNILKITFPISTLFVNILGCFILGILYIYLIEKVELSPAIKLALTVGFCGGLTTFSTFSLEIYNMIQNSQILYAIIYMLLSLVLGITAVIIGGYICKIFII